MDDDDRHLEVTAAPMSALVAAPEGAPTARPDRDRDRKGRRAEPGPDAPGDPIDPGVPQAERDPPDLLDSDPDVETGWAARLGRIRRIDRTQVMLTLAVAVALALAGALYLTQRQSDDEREITAAIERYTTAWNSHDVAAVRAAMYSGGTFSASDNISHEALFLAPWGPELDRVLTALFAANVKLETRGRVIFAGDSTRASVVQRFSYTVYGLRAVEQGISQYTLSRAERGPGLKIVQHVWWRPRVPSAPSMLWILDTSAG